MPGKIRVTMDRDSCISCGNCWAVCPDFFEESTDDGRSRVTARFRVGDFESEGDAPENLEDCVRNAATECPASVIRI